MIHNFSPLKSLQRLTISHQPKARLSHVSCKWGPPGPAPAQLSPVPPTAPKCCATPGSPAPTCQCHVPTRLPPLFRQFSCGHPGALLPIYPVPSSRTKYSSLERLHALSRIQDFQLTYVSYLTVSNLLRLVMLLVAFLALSCTLCTLQVRRLMSPTQSKRSDCTDLDFFPCIMHDAMPRTDAQRTPAPETTERCSQPCPWVWAPCPCGPARSSALNCMEETYSTERR